MNTSYKDLLEEVSNLNWEERRELAEVLNNGRKGNSIIYKVEPANGSDDNFIITYGCFDDSYLLTPASSAACLKEFEQRFCNGEDAESFCSFQIALEKV